MSNYGANRPSRVSRKADNGCLDLIYCDYVDFDYCCTTFSLIQIFSSDSALIADAVPALKLYFAALFLWICSILVDIFKSLNKKKCYFLFRKSCYCCSFILPFPYLFNMGSNGVFLAEPISNVIW